MRILQDRRAAKGEKDGVWRFVCRLSHSQWWPCDGKEESLFDFYKYGILVTTSGGSD